MQIRFSIGHHPPGDRFRLTDILSPIMAACDDLGIDAAVRDDEALEPRAISLFTEFFMPEVADFLVTAKKKLKDDFRFGILLTEDLRDQLIWTDKRAPDRLEGLKKVAAVADFLVTLLPDLDALADLASMDRVAYLPLGLYPGLDPAARSRAHKDIDVLFLGTDRGHRKPVLDALRQAGLRVAVTNGIATALVCQSMAAHSRIALDMRRGPDVRFLSPSRLSYLVSAGVPVISESFDETALGAEWHEYTRLAAYDDLVEECLTALSEPEHLRESEALDARARFVAAKPAKKLLADMLALPIFKGHFGY